MGRVVGSSFVFFGLVVRFSSRGRGGCRLRGVRFFGVEKSIVRCFRSWRGSGRR